MRDQSGGRLSRRNLLLQAGALGLAGCLPSGLSCPPARTGLQLYSIRQAMAVSVPQTLERVARLGFGAVEFAGYFGHSPAEIATHLAATGLIAPSNHVDARASRADPARVVADGARAGHRHLVVAWIPPEDRTSLEDWQSWADSLNRLGEACRAADLRCAYHNHDFEFRPIDGSAGDGGVTPWDLLQARCDPSLVAFEIDTYWVQHAGLDPAELVARAPDRFPLCHLKDRAADGGMAILGEGETDFAAVLAARGPDGFEQCYAELDNPVSPFGFAATAEAALSGILQANQTCPA